MFLANKYVPVKTATIPIDKKSGYGERKETFIGIAWVRASEMALPLNVKVSM